MVGGNPEYQFKIFWVFITNDLPDSREHLGRKLHSNVGVVQQRCGVSGHIRQSDFNAAQV